MHPVAAFFAHNSVALAGLGLLSALTALGVYLFNPVAIYAKAPEGAAWVSREALKETEILWVDARSAEEFRKGHFTNAVNLPPGGWAEGLPELLRQWKAGILVVVYCEEGCDSSAELAGYLKKAVPQMEIKILQEGYKIWR